MPQLFSHRFGFLLFIFTGPIGAATLTSNIHCFDLPPVQPGQQSCAGPLDSASAAFTSNGPFADLRVDTAATRVTNVGLPSGASASMTYNGLFLLNVDGVGSGFVLPIMTVTFYSEPAITSAGTARLGNVSLALSSTSNLGIGGGGTHSTAELCYFCRIPITFGIPLPVDLFLSVDAGSYFGLFPPSVRAAQAVAGASIQDFWVFDSSGQRISNPSVTFVEATPEPGTFGMVLLALAWLGYRNPLRRHRVSRRPPHAVGGQDYFAA